MQFAKVKPPPLTTLFAIFLVVLVATAGGVYLGYAVQGRAPLVPVRPVSQYRDMSIEGRFVHQPGARFPNDTLSTGKGRHITFDEYFDGKPAVLLFWSFGCDPCISQAQLWHEQMDPVVRSDVKVAVCLDEADQSAEAAHEELLEGKEVVYVGYGRLIVLHNLVIRPTIISVDSAGIITHIQYGDSPYFDQRLVELVTTLESTS